MLAFFESCDPLLAWQRRIRLDIALGILLFIVMLDRLTANPLHEALGLAAALMAGLHLALNRRWCMRKMRNLFAFLGFAAVSGRRRGKASLRGRLSACLTLAVTLLFAASLVSGIVCSQTLIAAVTPDAWRMDLSYRTVHVALSMWFFLAAGLHAGLHLSALAPKSLLRIAERLGAGRALGIGAAAAALLGLLAADIFVRREFLYLLRFESTYILTDAREFPLWMPLDLLAFLAAVIAAAALLDRALSRRI